MLLRLSGASGKLFVGDGQEEDEEGESNCVMASKQSELLIGKAIGMERRSRLFATIYLMRSDTMSSVGQMAWRVWKGVVQNTPRMIAQVLPILLDRVIADLASDREERQEAASASLGDLVQKMGDILQSVVPIFQERLRNGDPAVRQGVCLGLKEIMARYSYRQ